MSVETDFSGVSQAENHKPSEMSFPETIGGKATKNYMLPPEKPEFPDMEPVWYTQGDSPGDNPHLHGFMVHHAGHR